MEADRRSHGAAAPPSNPADSSPASSPAAAASASWQGRRIKRFRLIDELGEGAMGRVFVAEDTVLGRHVALKLLPARHRDGRPNHRTERLITEARSAATLEHPNVVTIHEIDQVGNVHYIAMELVEGGNLERLVQKSGPMEIGGACQLIAEAAEALGHAHERGIVHRDVKPANLLLSRSGRCKVCDFGLAMVEMPENDVARMRCVGTPYFIAPEIAQGRGATEASDIYSLGCTLFYLLTGRPPFPGTSSRQVMKMHVNDPLPDLRRWRPDAPPRLIEALEQACAKVPLERFKDAERFAATLRTFTIATPASQQQQTIATPGPANSSLHIAGSSANLTPIATINAPPIQQINAQVIQPVAPVMSHPALSHPGLSMMQSQVMNEPKRSAMRSPLIWAGAATVATAGLIALGMWLVRPGPDQANAAAPAASGEPSLFAPVKPVPPATPATPAPSAAKPDSSAKPQASPVAPAVPVPVSAVASTVSPQTPAAPAPQTVSGENVLLNGTMEDADTDDGVAGWFIHDRFKPQVQIMREAGAGRFLRLANDDTTRTVFADQRLEIDPAWKAITVKARMRASNFKSGKTAAQDGRVAFAFQDAAGKRVGNWPPVPSVKVDSGWVDRTVTADVPPGAKSLYIQLAIFNATGTVDFDDIQVIPQR